MKKGIWAIIVAAAFVAGTMTTGTVAYAASGGQGNDAIVQALQSVVTAIEGINPVVNAPSGQSCWDTNGNGFPDVPLEDLNGDSVVDVQDCKGPQGIQGVQGIPGIQGIQGPIGPSSTATTVKEFKDVDFPAGVATFDSVSCPEGTQIVGGGFTTGLFSEGLRVLAASPTLVGEEYFVKIFNDLPSPVQVRIIAVCLQNN